MKTGVEVPAVQNFMIELKYYIKVNSQKICS
jgi:hypothetical protein